ncbi:kinesin [Perkinsela sp. CCAP 1560/4]|nr:kinesin [Perkinsela sp. CCAP 1560/4]|eukprot:KNH08226.1 kinesin [Perkinsela sp. CCAP 1560/4]
MENPNTEFIARICWKGTNRTRLFGSSTENGDINRDGQIEGAKWEWNHFQIATVGEEPSGLPANCQSGLKNTSGKEKFLFDGVYGPGCNNTEFYIQAVRERILRIGSTSRNLTILVHGQSNAGRAHTMFGSDSSPGIISSVLSEVLTENSRRSVRLSATDIEHETMYDILSQGRGETKTLHSVPSCVPTMHDAHVLMDTIEDRRSKSCSSHCIVSLTISQGLNLKGETKRITFVDFGGIESSSSYPLELEDLPPAGKSEPKNSQSPNIEEANIRRAMLALTKCMKARSHPKSQIVSYRESKLTSILRESLANDDFLIICAIDAAIFKESLHALRLSASFRHKTDSSKHTHCHNATKKVVQGDLRKIEQGGRSHTRTEAMKALSTENTIHSLSDGILADSGNNFSIGGVHQSRTYPFLREKFSQLDSDHEYSAVHRLISEDLVSREMLRAEMLKKRINDGLELMQTLNTEISAVTQAVLESGEGICQWEMKREELLTQKIKLQEEVSNLHDEIDRQPHTRAKLVSLYEGLRDLLGKK